MLPKPFRLTDDYDFRRVRRLGKSYHTPDFVLSVVRAKDSRSLRFGFVTSTKLHKRAVKRNRAKRLLREAVRQHLDQIKPGFDVVLVAKKGVLEKGAAEVAEEMGRMLSKAGLLNGDSSVTSSKFKVQS